MHPLLGVVRVSQSFIFCVVLCEPLFGFPSFFSFFIFWPFNHISGVMVRVLPSSPVDRGFELRSSQTKDCKIGIRCFASPLSRKSRLVGSESG